MVFFSFRVPPYKLSTEKQYRPIVFLPRRFSPIGPWREKRPRTITIITIIIKCTYLKGRRVAQTAAGRSCVKSELVRLSFCVRPARARRGREGFQLKVAAGERGGGARHRQRLRREYYCGYLYVRSRVRRIINRRGRSCSNYTSATYVRSPPPPRGGGGAADQPGPIPYNFSTSSARVRNVSVFPEPSAIPRPFRSLTP